MIILLSPAKTLDFESEVPTSHNSALVYKDEAAYLAGKLKKFSARKLKNLMDISSELAQLNFERYQSMSFPFDLDNAKQALFAFRGDVYQGLKAEELSADDINFAQSHLRILSGLYGVLRPLDLMQPYRLEMGTDWAVTPKKKNLYIYWKPQLTKFIKREVEAKQAGFVLNLASQEYARAVDLKSVKVPVIAPEFREERGGESKMISFFAKKARGMMAAFAIKNKVTKPDELKSFGEEGYAFNKKLSDTGNNKWVFTRNQQS
ncbi:MAG: peroxide stress protein YaaA [Cryomorphaceae bacterium]|nr:peroxide stress protein YaaA [Flavobacteriales bacterium]